MVGWGVGLGGGGVVLSERLCGADVLSGLYSSRFYWPQWWGGVLG